MTSPRPNKDDSLWRDLAASVVQQVADRIRSASASGGRSQPADMGGEQTKRGDQDAAPKQQHGEDAAGERAPSGSLGGELKRLMINGIRATTDSLDEFQAARDRRAQERQQREAEREQRRREAPMRQARHRATVNKVGAVGLGLLTAGLMGGSIGAAVESDVPAAVVGGTVSVAAGAGTVSLARRSRRYSATAQQYAQALGLSSSTDIDSPAEGVLSVTLPPVSSLAHDPVMRLIGQRKALAELLPHIEGVAAELAPLARQSEVSLVGYAERIIRLERAQAAAASPSLDASLARAAAQLEDGVHAHQKLVEAAATVLAELESADYGEQAHEQIDAAADRLQALAEGLRQVRNDIPVTATDIGPTPSSADSVPPAPQPAARRSRKPNRRRDVAG